MWSAAFRLLKSSRLESQGISDTHTHTHCPTFFLLITFLYYYFLTHQSSFATD
ncbi:hypothetical protein DPEC_G00007280 [Dallia pectoralis]|uniref:Uncharacterized protein n=1 Tax=Dallia pectoralis TaxID=75939 RepID=A0ACC2HL79_DALPE|nr:hypothetical protein DPEC_G00007280 [Dallia pectoralis]